MPIDAHEVERIAALAKLEISAQDSERFTLQFQQILEYFTHLRSVETADVVPTYHALHMEAWETPFREDTTRESLPTADVMANAPSAADNQFVVPKVIE